MNGITSVVPTSWRKALKRTIVRIRPRALRVAAFASISLAALLFAACNPNEALTGAAAGQARSLAQASAAAAAATAATSPLGSASAFAVLGATTVTNTGASLITGNLGVYETTGTADGFAITGFDPAPANTIVLNPLEPRATVTPGPGRVTGTIYAGGADGSVVQKAQADAHTAYNTLVALPINFLMGAVQELKNLNLAPGVYSFPSSAHLDGTLTLTGNANSVFVFIIGSTLTTVTGSKVVLQGGVLPGNVYWVVGSSATIGTGTVFNGNIIAVTSITITTNVSMNGSALALGGAVTLDTDAISVAGGAVGVPGGGTGNPPFCKDFVSGGGWFDGNNDEWGRRCRWNNDKATFGVSGGVLNGKPWGQVSYNDHGRNGVSVKSTSVTSYFAIDATTREIDGVARVNGQDGITFKVIVSDKGPGGRHDTFSIELSNGYSASGTLTGGNIQLHQDCGVKNGDHGRSHHDRENYKDNDEDNGNSNCGR